jgi:chromosome segregation ATPase
VSARRLTLAREVAGADAVLTNELPARFVKAGNTDELVRVARQLERARARARKLRRELKANEDTIKRCKRELKALTAHIASGSDREVGS